MTYAILIFLSYMYIVQLYIGAPALPNHELWQQSLQSCASAERAPGVFGFAII